MEMLQVVVTHGARLDIHKKVIVATVFTPTLAETRSFGTVTDQLLALGDWLVASGVTHVAMEATGVYGKPVVNVLESYDFVAVWVVNPQTIRGMPGCKTDVQDSQWIASLLRMGALQGSYIPSRPQRKLRELVHYRTSSIQMRTQEANRLQKVLEGANVKLSRVITDILGVTGQRILAALAAGETDPVALAQLADGRIRASQETLVAALHGMVQRHQQWMLTVQWELITCLDRQIATLNTEISARLTQLDDALTRLETIPGVGRRTAEMGIDMQRFPPATSVPGQDSVPNKTKEPEHILPAPARAARLYVQPWWRQGKPLARPKPTWGQCITI